MAQARTCEEYVIQELYHKDSIIANDKKHIDKLQKQLEAALDKIQNLEYVIDIFNPRIDNTSNGEDLFINFTSVWANYDKEEYDFIKNELGLEEPETEVEETSENV